MAAESHAAAIDRIEKIVQDEKIACEFERVSGYLFSTPDSPANSRDNEMLAARRAGVPIERVAKAPFPSFDTGACLLFPQQAQIHPMRYLQGMTAAALRMGCQLFTSTHATKFDTNGTNRIHTSNGATVTAASLVVATNSPVNDLSAIHTKQAPYTTYAIGMRIPRGRAPRALYWDDLEPYHYARFADLPSTDPRAVGNELLIVGGEDHKTGHANDASERYDRLEQWARDHFQVDGAIEYRWSGQVFETMDGLAFIGHNPMDSKHVYVATGDSGMGMTHGTIAGMLLTDLICNRENPWSALYNPARKTLASARNFVSENVDVALQFGAWLTPGDDRLTEELTPGTGAVIRRGFAKVAVYRDDDDSLHELTATCPHLGCIVEWNGAEATRDCPCHGSRFDCHGHVICGPANSDLEPIHASAPPVVLEMSEGPTIAPTMAAARSVDS